MHRYLFSLIPPQIRGIAGGNRLNFSRPLSAQIDLPGTPPPLLLILILILFIVVDQNRLISDISDGGNRRRFSEENDGHFASSRSYSCPCHPGISPKDFKMDPAGPNQLATIQHHKPSSPQETIHVPTKDMVFFFEKSTNTNTRQTSSQVAHVKSIGSIILENHVELCRKINSQFEGSEEASPQIILRLQIVAEGDSFISVCNSAQC